MATQTFVSIPTEIQAEQWFPGKEVSGVTEIVYANPDGTVVGKSKFGSCITIHNQEAIVSPGDWVITEPDGIHHYPCKPDIFAKKYRLKHQDQSPPE